MHEKLNFIEMQALLHRNHVKMPEKIEERRANKET